MKIDQQYLKDFLTTIEDLPGPDTNIKELYAKGFDCQDAKFVFHIRLLDDQNLIARTDNQPGFGLVSSRSDDNEGAWVVVQLRLTSKGHDFIADLRQKEVWNSVKDNFKEASISELIDISKQLARGFTKKKIKELTGFDPD